MTSVFLDTSGLIALVNTDGQWHRRAEIVWAELSDSGAGLITTSLVLIELADGLSEFIIMVWPCSWWTRWSVQDELRLFQWMNILNGLAGSFFGCARTKTGA